MRLQHAETEAWFRGNYYKYLYALDVHLRLVDLMIQAVKK